MRVTKHFLQSIFGYYDVCMTYLQSYGALMRIFVSRNIIRVHLNIIICTSKIRQQNRTFEQIYSKFYQRKALTCTSNKNMAELFNHVYDLGPTTQDMVTGLSVVTRVHRLLLSDTTQHRSYITYSTPHGGHVIRGS